MAKKRKKKSISRPQNQPAVVHRYSAEDEEKKSKRKKLKLKGALLLIAVLLAALITWLINLFVL